MNDLDDQPIEQLLRDRFAHQADVAPTTGDLRELAGRAARQGRTHRRRWAAAGAALALVTVVGGVAVVGTLDLGAHRSAVPGASSPGTPDPSPSASASSGPATPSGPALMFRGAEVPVPAAMLKPGAVRCGTPVADAAYVDDRSLSVAACVAIPKQPERLTTVVMQPLEDVVPADRRPGGRQLPDGRWQVAGPIAEREVWLTVTSPDEQRAVRLFSSAVVVEAPAGCRVRPGSVPGPGSLVPGRALPQLSTAGRARVCGYRAGWLTGAATIPSGSDLTADLQQAPPASDRRGCNGIAENTPAGTGWWVELQDGTRLWVDGTRDCPLVYDEDGGAVRVTSRLVSDLWALAPGPASMSGLAG